MKIGMMELVVILLVAFFVLGPEKTVSYARKIGKWLKTLRIYVNSFTDDIRETVTEPLSEMAEPINDLAKPLIELVQALSEVTKAVQDPVNELKTAVFQTQTELTAPLASKKPSGSEKPLSDDAEELEEAVPVEPAEAEQSSEE